MQTPLTYALYVSMAVVFVVLVLGVVNMFSKSENQPSRSNKLMRLRVAAQFVAVLLLVAVGWASGMIGN